MDWHLMQPNEAMQTLNTSQKGLSEQEASNRLLKNGKNELISGKKINVFALLVEQFSSPLVIILIAAAAISFAFEKGIDGILILAIVVANAVFGFAQNYNAEKSIDALKKMGSSRALVVRDGLAKELDSKELVCGDIILLREGAKIPADCRLIEANEMSVDESILTGESDSVSKHIEQVGKESTLADRKCMLYMDTLVVRGKGKAVVVEIGMNTEVGKIAQKLDTVYEQPTRFHKEIEVLGKKITYIIIVLVAIIGATILFEHEASLIEALIISISVAVAAIPEGLPAVVTLSLAIATASMLKKNTLVRKLPVIENLGSVQVICTDKTGTLTENSMTVQQIYCNGGFYEVSGTGRSIKGEFFKSSRKINPKEIEEVLLCGLICNETIIQNALPQLEFNGDPTEVALCVSALKAGASKAGWEEVSEIPFSSKTRRMTSVVQNEQTIMSYSKGACEVILDSCTHFLLYGEKLKLDSKMRKQILEANDLMGSKALRVLAFASKELNSPDEQSEFDMTFLGLQGMIDPPRSEVAAALDVARQAGIRVVMLTGDNAATARAIGEQIGFRGQAIDGKDLEAMSEQEFEKATRVNDIFARVSPEQKYRVLRFFRASGQSVAMTGDGVNDAIALKEADVGIAMGIRGTDVAKQASDIVVLDDNFATIIEAIRQGRGVFDNIRKFVNYLLSNNLAEVFIVFIASIGGNLAITAVQLLWINLLTDGMPALALGADPPKKDIMKEPPRNKDEQIVTKKLGKIMLAISAMLTIVVLAIFYYYLPQGIVIAQTMVFTCLVFYEFVRIVVIRRQEKLGFFSNKWLVVALLGSFVLQLFVLYTPASNWFGTVSLGIEDWAIILLGGIVAYFSSVIITNLLQEKSHNSII
ncbi:MAG TPA: cation-translocating P-type ATPase [archaeon]|nr:cation-translocating P-type ATPase [archaeon]